ncbi:MAG: Arginine biosynthesis bifunctional protein ArgJ [Planctomycetota bacterium]|jgi:glutamate N-acetyltransferase/amino-acid N-acetyltransferase
MPASLPSGFSASGFTCGIKASGKADLALFVSDRPAAAAGVFTTNKVCGAPVIVSRQRVPSEQTRAVMINSGNSNAATGEPGVRDAKAMTALLAEVLGCESESVLVCSTGVIGVPLPMPLLEAGIPPAVRELGRADEHLLAAATAMMTTDTFPKLFSVDVSVSAGSIRVSGVCKGAAMIAPNMATMLGVVLTDARLSADQCSVILRRAVDQTFNCISVDGHMSTSDTVLMLAGGAAEFELTAADLELVSEAVTEVCRLLATSIIRDAEGADHFITIDVRGLASRAEAFRMAKEIANSPLVKTAITGGDPNWGRIVSAAGYAGVEFDPCWLSLRINGTEVYRAGTPVPFDSSALSRSIKSDRDVHLELTLAGGPASGSHSVRFWTSDLTAEYVRLNSEYTT